MTQEKEIEQAAREYADIARAYLLGEEMELVQDAFKAGAEWALENQWHKVSEQTPDTERDVVVVNEYNDFGPHIRKYLPHPRSTPIQVQQPYDNS